MQRNEKFQNIGLFLVVLRFSSLTPLCGTGAASPFTDHMVIQRETEIRIWDGPIRGENFCQPWNWQRTTITDTNAAGESSCRDASGRSFALIIRGKKTIVFRDVMLGEVWVASGQSNMTYALSGATAATRNTPGKLSGINSSRSKENCGRAQSDTLPARGKYVRPRQRKVFGSELLFARHLHKELGVPSNHPERWPGTAGENGRTGFIAARSCP